MPLDIEHIASSFVAARRAGRALAAYPGGQVPETLDAGYACQDRALALWPDHVAGWKVGLVPPALRPRLGAERLAGPIFQQAVQMAPTDGTVSFPVYPDGFAAVEAEFVIKLARDIPPGPAPTLEEAGSLVAALHIGIEPAGSPLASINDLGPTVVVSDFGNNNGLIIGPDIPDWHRQRPEDLYVETMVDDVVVGRGTAASIPGGPLAALVFLIGLMGRRGLSLSAGSWVSTGAATGIHRVDAGARALVRLAGATPIRAMAVAAA